MGGSGELRYLRRNLRRWRRFRHSTLIIENTADENNGQNREKTIQKIEIFVIKTSVREMWMKREMLFAELSKKPEKCAEKS